MVEVYSLDSHECEERRVWLKYALQTLGLQLGQLWSLGKKSMVEVWTADRATAWTAMEFRKEEYG